MCNEAVRIDPWLLYDIPNYLETQKMCNEAVRIDPWLLCDIPNYLKTQKMCNEVIKKAPWMQFDVPDRFRNLGMSIRAPLRLIPLDHPKTEGVCERAVEKDPQKLKDVPYHLKREKMCERAVEKIIGA